MENRFDYIEFPTIKNTKVHYFDYAATTFMPQRVMDKWCEFNSTIGVSISRGNGILTRQSEQTKQKSEEYFRKFFRLSEEYENIYAKNVTEAINILALSLEKQIKTMDMIVVGPFEHHSNYLPWKYLAKRTGALFCEIPLNENGDIDYSYLLRYKERIKIFSVSAVSNSFGYQLDIDKICNILGNETLFFVDESQVTAHMKMVVNPKIAVYFIPSHKMYAPKNIAMMSVRKDLLDKLSPVILGGGMVEKVGFEDNWLEESKKFIAGTLDISLIATWAESCKFISEISYEKIQEKNAIYSKRIVETINKLGYKQIKIDNHCVDYIISFVHPSLHAHDVSEFLSDKNIIIRSGNVCSQNALRKIETSAINRISLGLGVTDEDINIICKSLEELVI